MKELVPDIQYEDRAKSVSQDLARQVLDLGIRIWVNIKFWIERVGLPNFHTHVDFPDQPTRRGKLSPTSHSWSERQNLADVRSRTLYIRRNREACIACTAHGHLLSD